MVAGALTQRGGVLDLERGALSGSGSVGVSGGRVLLPGTVAPSVSVSGGEAAIRGRRADLSSVAISNGTFKVLADAANVTLSSDLIISGGALRFPERDSYAATHRNNLHTGTRNLDRGTMVVHGHLNWTDGAISGNGDVNLMASSSVRSGFIERFARVVPGGGPAAQRPLERLVEARDGVGVELAVEGGAALEGGPEARRVADARDGRGVVGALLRSLGAHQLQRARRQRRARSQGSTARRTATALHRFGSARCA